MRRPIAGDHSETSAINSSTSGSVGGETSEVLVLLCHNLSMIESALAAGAARQLACQEPGNGDADGGDRSLHMAFRPQREICGVDNLRVTEVS